MSVVDDAIGWINSQIESAGNQIENITDAWTQKVNELKAKAYEFTELYNRVQQKMQQLPPDSPMRKEAQETLSTADKVRATIEGITSKIDSVAGSLSYFNVKPVQMDAIFLAPVPLAIIAGAIALLGTQIVSLRKLDEKLDHEQFLIEKGADPNLVVRSGASKPFIDLGLKNPLIFIGVGAGIWFAWQNRHKWFK